MPLLIDHDTFELPEDWILNAKLKQAWEHATSNAFKNPDYSWASIAWIYFLSAFGADITKVNAFTSHFDPETSLATTVHDHFKTFSHSLINELALDEEKRTRALTSIEAFEA